MEYEQFRYLPLSKPRRGASGWVCNVQDHVTGAILVAKYASAGTSQARALELESEHHEDLQHPGLAEFVSRIQPHRGIKGARASVGLVTRWIDAVPIEQWALERTARERAQAATSLLAPVNYLHRRGLLHLDVKPKNVLAGADGRVTLIDLGSARPTHEGPGEIGGTWGFAAPELSRREAPSEASDAYSIGVLYYHLLTGRSPWPEAGNDEPMPLRALAPDVEPALAKLVMQLLSTRSSDRVTLSELATALQDLDYDVPRMDEGRAPLVGREEMVRDLRALVSTATDPVAVVGRPGAGRRRLIQGLVHTVDDSVDAIDVSWTTELRACMDRAPPDTWVFVGDLDQLPASTLARIRELSASGMSIRCIGVANAAPQGFTSFPVGPMRESDLLDLASFTGRRLDGTVRSMAQAAAGRPGAMLAALGIGRAPTLAPGAAEALTALRSLPPGTPVAPFLTLEGVAEHLDALRAAELIRVVDETLYVTPSDEHAPQLHPITAEVLAGLVESGATGADPTWRALALALLDRPDEAVAALPAPSNRPGPPTLGLWRLYRLLSRAGRPEGHRGLAQVALADGSPDLALEALAKLERLSPSDHEARVTAHRARNEPGAALQAAREAVSQCPHPQTWCVLGSIRLLTGDLPGAEDAIRQAQASDSAGSWSDRIFGLRLSHALAAARSGELIDSALITQAQERIGRMGLSAADLSRAGRAALRYGDVNAAVALLGRATQEASAQGDLRASAYAWLHLGNAELRRGSADGARVALAHAIRAARAAPAPEVMLRGLYAMTELELRSGRLPAAERHLRAFHAHTAGALEGEVRQRSALLRAALDLERQRFDQAIAALDQTSWHDAATDVLFARAQLRAAAQLELGDPAGALAALQDAPPPATDRDQRQTEMLRGRAHLAIGRQHLARAAAQLPPPGPRMDRQIAARITAAHAGEDLDPASFGWRREALDRAAALLTGVEAVRAADLRDRLLQGPGAQLDGMAELIETVQDPARFPAALARLVREALGANRVLILVRIPGMGRQMTFSELTDREAAGLSVEILRRIQGPDDVWLADNAVADPHLRSISATVRTLSIRSVVAVAIPQGDRALGVLYVDDVHRANRFQEEHVTLLKRLAAAAAALLPLMSPATIVAREPQELHGVVLAEERKLREIRSVLDRLRGQPQANLLISGATGTGKTWLARRIATDVLGLDGLVEATMRRTDVDRLVGLLAGTRKGDFTGAVSNDGLLRRCALENAALFIDEVHALDEDAQVALLPLMELPKRRFASLTTSTNLLDRPLTILLGTNIPVRDWRLHFREDFWFRIGGLRVHLPTLAERGPDVVFEYLRSLLRRNGIPSPEETVDPEGLSLLTHHDWPGNLRDLEQVVDRIAFEWHRTRHRIAAEDIRSWLGAATAAMPSPRVPDQAFLDEILALLPVMGWNQTQVARKMQTTASRINRTLKRAGMLDVVRRQKALLGPGESLLE